MSTECMNVDLDGSLLCVDFHTVGVWNEKSKLILILFLLKHTGLDKQTFSA